MAASWTPDDVAGVLRRPTAADDKYTRGVLGVRTGSVEYPGAAVLGVEAAWRTGVGMVRYTGPAADLVLARRPETVTQDGRVQAWLVGSGTSAATRTAAETAAVRGILDGDVPVVVDAGALDLVPGARALLVVTPHDREHARLRELLGLPAPGDDREADAVSTARALDGVVLLKGARTVVATPDGVAAIVTVDVPWLAAAGTGDVLAGVVGALAAGAAADGRVTVPACADAGASGRGNAAASLAPVAASAAWLHARAAALAADRLGAAGGPITALDVAAHLPMAVAEALAAGRPSIGAGG